MPDSDDKVLYVVADHVARITINRPAVYNAFDADTCEQLIVAFRRAGADRDVRVVVLTGAGDKAFCSGGDQKERGSGGYSSDGQRPMNVDALHTAIRHCPKPVIAMVNGFAIGGGHVLHVLCDLSIAADTAVFGQTGPRVGSVDAGHGTGYLARVVGEKKAREIWYLCRQYSAQDALAMGLVNKVVPLEQLEATTIAWCRKIIAKSPLAIRMLKASFNAELDGQAGIQELAGNATLLYYLSAEAQEGKNAFLEKRDPDWDKFPKFP